MAFNNITKADTNNKGVTGLADTPGLSAAEMQKKFDELSTDVIIPKYNEVVDTLNGDTVSEDLHMEAPDNLHFGAGLVKTIGHVIRTIANALFEIGEGNKSPAQTIQEKLDKKVNETEIDDIVKDKIDAFSVDIVTKVDAATATADTAKATADGADTKADNATTTANEAKQTADTVSQTVASTIQKADDAYTLASYASDAAASASVDAAQAVKDATDAASLAGQAKQTADSVSQNLSSTTQKADNAFNLATTANTNASSALASASQAVRDASNAADLADQAKQTADSASTGLASAISTANSAYDMASNASVTALSASADAMEARSVADQASEDVASATEKADEALIKATEAYVKPNGGIPASDIASGVIPSYSSKAAASGGTDLSLVTTGEKATWNAKTSNVGTITGVKMNGASKGTSGVVDLGTVITAHQSLSAYATKQM